jgi:hypothetical protein
VRMDSQIKRGWQFEWYICLKIVPIWELYRKMHHSDKENEVILLLYQYMDWMSPHQYHNFQTFSAAIKQNHIKGQAQSWIW